MTISIKYCIGIELIYIIIAINQRVRSIFELADCKQLKNVEEKYQLSFIPFNMTNNSGSIYNKNCLIYKLQTLKVMFLVPQMVPLGVTSNVSHSV